MFSFVQKLTAVFGLLYSCVIGVKKIIVYLGQKNASHDLTREGKNKKMGHLFITLIICCRGRVRCGQWERSAHFSDVLTGEGSLP